MKQSIYLLSLLFIISSCSTLDNFDDITKRADAKYKIMPNGKASYIATVPAISITKKHLISTYAKDYSYNLSDSINENQKIMWYLNSLTDMNEDALFDSIGTIHVYFDERNLNPNSKIEAFYYWDYSNIRFLVPFLLFGNEEHKRNQCVNRAIEACYRNNMDAVVISPTLHHFKLYNNQ